MLSAVQAINSDFPQSCNANINAFKASLLCFIPSLVLHSIFLICLFRMEENLRQSSAARTLGQ